MIPTEDASALDRIWGTVSASAPATPLWLVLGTALIAVAAVCAPQVWPVTRNVVTIAHEGAHALVALLCGRRLAGIRLHSDTSGVTVSAGKPYGMGMVATAFAGYVGPSLIGLGAAATLAAGYVGAMLWGTLVLLGLMLLQIRNFYGALTMLLTGGAVFVVSWWTPSEVQSAFAYLLTWFLLLAGPKPVYELQSKRRVGEAAESDADQLATLTGIPGIVWVGAFGLVTIGALGLASFWLIL